ncbi:MAG: MMPL family transporter [Bacteroidota bacterium]
MVAKLTKGFWPAVARIILRNRILILCAVAAATVFLVMQWKNIQFSNTEANILPDDHPATIQYKAFTNIFGEEGNAIVLAVRDEALFETDNFNRWNKLSKQLEAFPEVDFVVSTDNLKILEKDTTLQRFVVQPFLKGTPTNSNEIDSLKNNLIQSIPFYEGLIYNKDSETIQTIAYLDKDIMSTPVRNEFILNDLGDLVKNFEQETNMDVRVSGMPYIRTWNTKSIVDEIGIFIAGALLVTSLIFFFFFRSFRATFISMCVVIIGVMWAFGILGLLQYEITILTALIPPLIIVIGIPNCIFLINKYQQEVKKHGNQALSLQRVISKIGNATLMTNVTTASGFATFIILDSDLLKEFGIVASINIIGIFILSLLIIPIIYSFMALPKTKHLKHLNKKWIDIFVNWMERMVRDYRIGVYITSVIVLVLSIVGIYQIKITGSRIEDLPKNTHYFKDIRFFEEEFDGIMPLEIVVDTKRKNGAIKPATLRRMDQLGTLMTETPELSRPVSVVDLVKYSKQVFYNGIPKYYQLPTSQENTFIMDMVRRSSAEGDLLESFMDSTGQTARITAYLQDVKIERMEEIESDMQKAIDKFFPSERYTVFMTGKALLFLKGTRYLVKNLLISLALAIGLISLFMAYLFRSFRMIVISLVPNLLLLSVLGQKMNGVINRDSEGNAKY